MFEYINAFFEAGGAWLAWRNAAEVYRTKGFSEGVYSPLFFFSATWALFCVPYYLEVGHGLCAFFASVRCVGLAAWVLLHQLRGMNWR